KVKKLRAAGLITGPVYGFKTDRIDKLGPKWVKLEEGIEAAKTALITKNNLEQEIADYNAAVAHRWLLSPDNAKLFATGTPIRKYVDELKRMKHPSTSLKMIELMNTGAAVPWLKPSTLPSPSIALDVQAKLMLQRYPMLKQASLDGSESITEIADIAAYVKLVESK
ncbi:MAG TPA: hypothetical protein VKH37_03530, partial [Ferruginibacter sp.]|nr:hypothetical protein [Ferruginibacter sp.]